ncbi:hypothetical protein CDAR_422391 [Caerostris darwini]|uniref:Uncharacterized protein n=1 Tax=Caerostris darwini TaxID=1538125 RepID=A0AAV4WY26_9ARAC|nr:hypothetical protein CDAR_422391 [Caerostris darwini]
MKEKRNLIKNTAAYRRDFTIRFQHILNKASKYLLTAPTHHLAKDSRQFIVALDEVSALSQERCVIDLKFELVLLAAIMRECCDRLIHDGGFCYPGNA